MMNLSQQMQQNIKNVLQTSPLLPDELRRVEGMGELYIGLSREFVGSEYTFLYSLEIEGKPHYFFGKMS